MPSVSKLFWRACWSLFGVLLAGAVLVALAGPRRGGRAVPALPPDDWHIPQLVSHLNREGLGLRVVSTQRDGAAGPNAFLTTTDKEWIDLTVLPKDRQQIDRWRGTLYCERFPSEVMRSDQACLWGDCCLVAGPFLLYGDRQLLARVRAALSCPPASENP
jgi:hypothetical protein